MTIIRGAGPGDAVVAILRSAAQDSRLSFRARGILVSVMSRPEEWRTGYRQLAEEAPEGERAVLHALRELERHGYLRRARVHNGRHLVTAWEMSDNPGRRSGGTLLQPTHQQPSGVQRVTQQRTKLRTTEQQRGQQQPGQQQPRTQQPADQQPGQQQHDRLQPVLKGEREGEIPPPGEPAPEHVDELERVVVVVIRGKAPTPGRSVLRKECTRLARLSWTPAQLHAAIEGHDWTGARAGAVITHLRQLQAPGAAPDAVQDRPPWCGACDEATRQLEDAQGRVQRCPTCHPLTRKDPA